MLELPEHLTLSIMHNEHKNYYLTVEEYLKDFKNPTWVSEESRTRAIADDDMWMVQVYPRTPISFYVVFGRSLVEILDYIKQMS